MSDLQGNTIAATATVTAGISMTTPALNATTISIAGGLLLTRVSLTYGTTIATNAALGTSFLITVTDGVAFTISAPTNLVSGQTYTYTIKNTSGGAVGTITWNAIFKMAALTTPATANQRSITFLYDGTNLIELYKTAADVPN